MNDQEYSNILLEALKCLRYDTKRIERMLLKAKSSSKEEHEEVITKLQHIDELIKKWSENV